MRVLLTGKKFTAFTRSATALGSSKLPRYYAVIEMDGGGLAVLLVKHGFARVHSTKVNHPDGTKADDYIETLAEMEKSAEAAKAGLCLPFLGRRWRRPRFNLVGLWMFVGPEFNRRHEFECLPFWLPFLPRQSQPLPATQDGCIRRRGLARTLVICSPDHRPGAVGSTKLCPQGKQSSLWQRTLAGSPARSGARISGPPCFIACVGRAVPRIRSGMVALKTSGSSAKGSALARQALAGWPPSALGHDCGSSG